MKNLIALSLAVIMGLGSLANAAPKRSFPNQKDGSAVAHPDYGGYSFFTEVNTTETVVCTGKCLLAGIYRSTGADTTSVEVRNTDQIGASDVSQFLGPRQFFSILGTRYTYDSNSRPILASQGISVKLSATGAGEHVTILYIKLEDDGDRND